MARPSEVAVPPLKVRPPEFPVKVVIPVDLGTISVVEFNLNGGTSNAPIYKNSTCVYRAFVGAVPPAAVVEHA